MLYDIAAAVSEMASNLDEMLLDQMIEPTLHPREAEDDYGTPSFHRDHGEIEIIFEDVHYWRLFEGVA